MNVWKEPLAKLGSAHTLPLTMQVQQNLKRKDILFCFGRWANTARERGEVKGKEKALQRQRGPPEQNGLSNIASGIRCKLRKHPKQI